ncbi:MAG: LysM peptidoglycan-binding domain-containing protein [Clostridium sp.]|nr:LysM peptidoglycan-binding domain-containing protein [Clostridium sp.]
MKYKRQFIVALICIIALSGVFLAVSYLGNNLEAFNPDKEESKKVTEDKKEIGNKEITNETNTNIIEENKDSSKDKNNQEKKEDENIGKKDEGSDKTSQGVKEGYYIVKSNDTLYSIARTYMPSYNTSEVVKGIQERNNIGEDKAIITGQKLIISYEANLTSAQEANANDEKLSSSEHNNHVEYTVKSGDTLFSIAGKYMPKTDTVDAINIIKTHNKMENDIIKINDVICIPNE